MSRIRTIKPEFWSSEQILDCQPMARLLFIGLWNFSDDWGSFPDKPKQIKACVFPGDEITAKDIDTWLAELAARKLILRYRADIEKHRDEPYLYTTGWFDHQKIDHPSAPKYPGPPGIVRPNEEKLFPKQFAELSPNARRSLAPDSIGVESKGKEGRGREGSPRGGERRGGNGTGNGNGHAKPAARASPSRSARDLPLAKAPVARSPARGPDRVQQLTQPVLAHYGGEKGLALLEAYTAGDAAARTELDGFMSKRRAS